MRICVKADDHFIIDQIFDNSFSLHNLFGYQFLQLNRSKTAPVDLLSKNRFDPIQESPSPCLPYPPNQTSYSASHVIQSKEVMPKSSLLDLPFVF